MRLAPDLPLLTEAECSCLDRYLDLLDEPPSARSVGQLWRGAIVLYDGSRRLRQ